MRTRSLSITAALLAAAMPFTSLPAATVTDAAGDLLGTYSGPPGGDLDILSANAYFDGTNFRLGATFNGAVGTTANSLYVFGINRGAGSERLTLGTPSIGQGVKFDAVAVLFPDGLGRIATFPPAGPPTITQLPGAVSVAGNSISGLFSLALLPSRGFAPEDYTFTLWSRARVNPLVDGTNAEIADFLPDGASFTASVPEPATWAMMILGFGLVGAAARNRRIRTRAFAAATG